MDSTHNSAHTKVCETVIYYGAYSQAWRGRERRLGILPKAITEEKSAAVMKDPSSYPDAEDKCGPLS